MGLPLNPHSLGRGKEGKGEIEREKTGRVGAKEGEILPP